ncbi:TetR/AcrR family transcriptional regulator [Streptomyces uncialis]|uniref:HTH tetR-type domain-containing protein n=1 Tax=Streptomyces uncialis TaxID=1048205 RepID=A0A1Q4UYW0_9ACTN|nr:TetR/AcrR family transcriptional regulator [Streptomyces uncialis]OKH90802.1 hypothetical protein AB852_29960 [Streptomyces uncialis]
MRLSSAQRREAVVRAAVTEFAAGGFHGTPMDRIAGRAGISQPYLFRLFPNKRTLFEKAVERCFQETGDFYARAAEGLRGTDALDAMARSRKRFLDDSSLPLLRLHAVTAVLAAGDPGITDQVRRSWAALWFSVEDRTGAPPAEVRAFFAQELLMIAQAALEGPRGPADDRGGPGGPGGPADGGG